MNNNSSVLIQTMECPGNQIPVDNFLKNANDPLILFDPFYHSHAHSLSQKSNKKFQSKQKKCVLHIFFLFNPILFYANSFLNGWPSNRFYFQTFCNTYFNIIHRYREHAKRICILECIVAALKRIYSFRCTDFIKFPSKSRATLHLYAELSFAQNSCKSNERKKSALSSIKKREYKPRK